MYTAPVNATFLWTPASVPDGGATLILLGTAMLAWPVSPEIRRELIFNEFDDGAFTK